MSGETPSGRGRRAGKFLGMPYDFGRPSWARLKSDVWDPSDRRAVKPKGFLGLGWAVNFREIGRRLNLIR